MSSFKYDEFGNYLGGDDSDTSEDQDQILHDTIEPIVSDNESVPDNTLDEIRKSSASFDDNDEGINKTVSVSDIVLHEDKKYYPDADEIYPGAEVSVHFDDQQDIDEPLIKPSVIQAFSFQSGTAPSLRYSFSFLSSIMAVPALVRNVAILGHLHHGKTTLMDLLIDSTVDDTCGSYENVVAKDSDKKKLSKRRYERSDRLRYTDTRKDEQQRGMSIKATPHSLVLQDGRGKSFLINAIDCPGHLNFHDEVTMALHACDGCILVVDAVEGPMISTKTHIKLALSQKLPIVLVISKIDRLIHELKLPPNDAYHKLAYIIDAVNAIIHQFNFDNSEFEIDSQNSNAYKPLNPRNGNVLFASGKDGWCFNLESFVRLHISLMAKEMRNVDPVAFSRRLWGDLYYDPKSNKFEAKSRVDAQSQNRSFVQVSFIHILLLYVLTAMSSLF